MKAWRQNRYVINIILSVIAIGIIIFYSICGNSCSYLKGSIFGVELQYIGIAYMAALIFASVFRTDALILLMLSAGMGVEVFLAGFQIKHAKYCPYCLVFGAIVLLLFVLNFDRKKKLLIAASMIISLLLFAMLFRGTAFPTYAFT